MSKRKVVAAAASLVGLVAVVVIGMGVRNRSGQLLTDAPETLSLGAKVYQAQCASCHGAGLEGQADWRERGADGLLPAPPHDESGHTWHHPDDVLFRITKYGVAKVAKMKDYRSNMPAFEGVLTDAEIIAVLSWIRSRWPADVRAQQEQINEQYEEARR